MSMKLIGFDDVGQWLLKAKKDMKPVLRAEMVKTRQDVLTEWRAQIVKMDIIKTGDYRKLLQDDPIDNGLGFEVGTILEYPVFQEYGTRSISPRPAMRVTAKKTEKMIDDMSKRVLEKITK